MGLRKCGCPDDIGESHVMTCPSVAYLLEPPTRVGIRSPLDTALDERDMAIQRAEAAEAELAKLKGDIALAKTLILSQEHAHKIVRVLGG